MTPDEREIQEHKIVLMKVALIIGTVFGIVVIALLTIIASK